MSRAKRFVRQRMNKAGPFCQWCGTPIALWLPEAHPERATADHIVPKSAGGQKVRRNIVAACRDCNSKRANMPATEWLARGWK